MMSLNQSEKEAVINANEQDPMPTFNETIADSSLQLTGEQRNQMYEKGSQLQAMKKAPVALTCFLACIADLPPQSGFVYLPQCLRKISEIYYGLEEYNKAVQFLQAEKMYYETALVDSGEMQRLLAASKNKEADENDESLTCNSDDPEALKAHEYENLSKLCLQEKRAELALEFCGKAAKLYQRIYGEGHAITLRALDFFTLIYAEVGKHQYSETIKRFKEAQSAPVETIKLEEKAAEVPLDSGLRQRKANKTESPAGHLQEDVNSQKEKAAEIIDGASIDRPEIREGDTHDEMQDGDQSPVLAILLLLLLVWTGVVLLALVLVLQCQPNDTSFWCHHDVKATLHYWRLIVAHYYERFISH